MENYLQDVPTKNLVKPKFGSYFTLGEKFRFFAVRMPIILAGAWGAAHWMEWDKVLDPTYPLATDAELLEENYPNRTAMMETLIKRIKVTASCTLTTRSYRTINVYADRPFSMPEGDDEREVKSSDDVLPTCINIIREELSHGRGIYATYQINIRNAWSGSASPPGFGPFEQDDENGNGIPHENIPFTLGNKWHDNDAIDRFEEAQEEMQALKAKLRDRDSSVSNMLDRSWQWAQETAGDAIDYVEEKFDKAVELAWNKAKQNFWNNLPWGGSNNEASPS